MHVAVAILPGRKHPLRRLPTRRPLGYPGDRNTGASDVLIEGDAGEEVMWTDDMHELMGKLGALPAFFGGTSSGARTSILFALRYPQAVRGLLLMRVTGGPFAAARAPR